MILSNDGLSRDGLQVLLASVARGDESAREIILADCDRVQAQLAALSDSQQQTVWPNIVAPAKYENPDPRWEDPKLPDFTLIWKLAREVGYAVGIHGSLKRDVDLIAAPWTDEAVGNKALIDHLCAGLNATMRELERKPCGRYACTLQIDGYYKPIDLSIMPRHTDLQTELQQAVEALAGVRKERDELKEQINIVANLIIDKVPGEPSQNQGACETVVRIVAALQAKLQAVEAAMKDWYAGKQSGKCGHIGPHEHKIHELVKALHGTGGQS